MHRRDFLGLMGAVALGARWAHAESDAPLDGEVAPLTPPGGGDNRATYMPDGQALLFASNRSGRSQIWVMDSDGTHARRVHGSDANDHGRVAPNASGTRLCFSSDRDGENGIYVLDLRAGGVTRVSDPAWWSFGPTWSTRDRIAYFSRKGGNRINLWTIRSDGGDARQLTDRPGESRQPWWSPDGTTLAFSADGGTGAYQLFAMPADGGDARALTRAGSWQQPFWSPDGRRLAVAAKLAPQAPTRILVMDLDGGATHPIAQPLDADNVHPAWSPNGQSIVFTSGKGAAAALWRFSFA